MEAAERVLRGEVQSCSCCRRMVTSKCILLNTAAVADVFVRTVLNYCWRIALGSAYSAYVPQYGTPQQLLRIEGGRQSQSEVGVTIHTHNVSVATHG